MAKSSWEDAGGRGEQHSPERQRQRKGEQEHASDRVVGRADDLVVADRRVAGWVGDALTAAMMKAESSRLSTTTMVAVNSVAQPEKRAWAPARWTIATANNAISRAPAVWSHAETRIALWKRVAKATSWAKVAVSNGMFGETKKCAVRATTPTTLLAELATLGVARISYGSLLHHDAMRHFTSVLTSLTGDPVAGRH